MKLVVGLGNPGKEYEKTRHNMGFLAIDALAETLGADFDRSGFKGEYSLVKGLPSGETAILLKPQTFMNLSGESVQALSAYFKIQPEDILVIYDEMALEPGVMRMRPGGSSAGHKGMQSIIALLGTDKIKRIRVGIGEPPYHNPVDHVLGKPSEEEWAKIGPAIDEAAKAALDYLKRDFDFSMNRHNSRLGGH